VVGALLAALGLAFAGTVVFVLFGSSQGMVAPDRSTNTDSRALPDAAAKLAFLERYMKVMSPVQATEFHIVYQNNDWAPSDWDMRVALKVLPSDVPRWTAGMTPRSSAPDFRWVERVAGSSDTWSVSSAPAYYDREGCTLEAHAAEGVLFKACSSLRLP